MNLRQAHANSVHFLNLTIKHAEEVIELATDNTPVIAIHAIEAGIKKANELIERHKGETEVSHRMMNELRTIDQAISKSVSEAKTHERYAANQ